MIYARLYSSAIWLICLVALVVVSSQNTFGHARDTEKRVRPRILRGKEAPEGRFPYMCSLRVRGSREHKCGGLVIHPRWVLTAAHCVDPNYDGSVGLQPVIYCGIHEVDDDSPNLTFSAIGGVLHPRWNKKVEEGFDIAMLKLDKKADSPISGILQKENAITSGSVFTALGWGKTEERSNYSEKLNMADLVFVPPDICRSNGYNVDDDRMVCAGLANENTCEGDSGGPLLQPDAPKGDLKAGRPELDLLVGITSYGLGSCTDEGSFGIYTRAGHYSEWIQNVISNAVVNQGNKPETETSDDDDDEMMTAVSLEDEDSAPPSDSEGPSRTTGTSRPPQPETCATSSKLRDVVKTIKDDDATEVQVALDCGLDLDSRYNDTTSTSDRTLLHWAARYNSSDSAKMLIESGADMEAKNRFGNTPLHYCGLFGSVPIAKVLIDSGTNVNARGLFRFKPLHYAASGGHVESVELLLDSGADVDSRDSFGTPPLHDAARKGHDDVAKILLSAGADPNTVDNDGNAVLHLAAFGGHVGVVELLLEEGVDVDVKRKNGETSLHVAARKLNIDAVEFLIENEADVNAATKAGHTPLHSAAIAGSAEIVEVRKSFFLNRVPDRKLLHSNVALNLQVLLEGGARIDAKDENKTTALHEAAGNGHNKVVEALIQEGADVDAKDSIRHTPLHAAAIKGDADTVKILVDAGANIDATDSFGETPLHEAAEYGYLDVVKVLIEAGASKRIRDKDGNRPKGVVCRLANPKCKRATRLAVKNLVAP